MSTATYPVTGMTCAHCVASVTEEVAEVAGVTDVVVSLEASTITVTGDEAVVTDTALIRAAVVEAGYELPATA